VPATDPAYQTAGTNQIITASVPAASTYIFSTTIGTWVSSGTGITTQVAGAAGLISETLQNPGGGTSTVVVIDNSDGTKVDTTSVIFTSGAAPDTITFQANKTVLSTSTATVQDSTIITAYAKNSSLPVANTGILFTLGSGGTGAFLSTAYAVTDSTGKATVTFTSGTTGTDSAGINVTATSVAAPAISDSVNLLVGGVAGSVVIGVGSVIFSNAQETAYRLPVAVMVADSNGSPIAGATVNLNNWPLFAYTGYRTKVASDCVTTRTYGIANEDINRNLNLDAGEDLAYSEAALTVDFNNDGDQTDTIVADGLITPANTAGGTLPLSVTTDQYGVGSFELTYLKQYSGFVKTEITATTLAFGSETIGRQSFTLYVIDDADEQCNLGPSPFNP
jgi:hypothetical protein